MKIIHLDPKQFNDLSINLEKIIINQPILTQLIPDQEKRHRYLKYTIPILLNYGHRYGKIYTFENLKGSVIFLNPGEFPISLYKLIGCCKFIDLVKMPWLAMLPLFKINKMFDAVHKAVIKQNHWWLYLGCVDPELRKGGLGISSLKSIFTEIDQLAFLPCYASATEKQVVVFLMRNGFKIIQKIPLPNSDYIYAMVRQPKGN